MNRLRKLLVVGGTGRNVGKTEFACRLIALFAARADIYGLKVSAVYPGEMDLHGAHPDEVGKGVLFREVRRDSNKDTARMLRAGAKEVYYLRDDGANIAAGYRKFTELIPQHALVVCESNSLAGVVRPGLHLVVRTVAGPVKERSLALLTAADLVVVSDGVSGFPELMRIDVDDGGWLLTSG
jgi:hypothetical protein